MSSASSNRAPDQPPSVAAERTAHDPVRIGVIGGEGQMGVWLRRFWAAHGCPVRYSDRATSTTNPEVVRWAQVTFVAVPLRPTPSVLRELAPCATDGRALVSIASLMQPSAQALADVPGEALCAHPVFGPTVTTTQGLPVAVAPIRGTFWSDWLVERLRGAGLTVQVTQPDTHDARMALVQALLHSLFVSLTTTFATLGLPAPEALPWASPTLTMQFGLIARILGQDPELYAELTVGNPSAPAALEALSQELQRMADLARRGDRVGFVEAFVAARASFGADLSPLAAAAEAALAHGS